MQANRFLFIGDSLIEFFNWQKRFPDREIVNYGIAGETAEGLLARLPGIIDRVHSPDLVMIMTGINNVAIEDYGFLFTYEKIITRLRETYGQATIAMVSLLPADLFFLGDAVPRINRKLQDIAQNNTILYLDLYPLFLDDNSLTITSYFETDGVHLSNEGYEVWAKALENTVFPRLD
jgi:lysophospholipase L1-like esterase